MLFLPAAALCCLCSALAAMATQLRVDDLTLTSREGQSVSFSCGGMDLCNNSGKVYWFQKKETFKAIFYINKNTKELKEDFNHPQLEDFSVQITENSCELKIDQVTLNHSASYFCCCYIKVSTSVFHVADSEKLNIIRPENSRQVFGAVFLTVWMSDGRTYGHPLFGSGTKLYVTDEKVVKPVVSVYPAASRAHLEGKSSLLCLASDMFPPLVQISWKRQKKDGDLEDLPPVEGEQLELRESGRTASILLVHRQENGSSKYSCSVQHEGGRVEAQTLQELPAPAASCPPERPDLAALQQADLSFQSQCRVKLLCLLYTVLIVKSLVYCCGLSLLMMLRTKGPSTI
ncbi:immunoglobulin lambda-1 light chain-like [Girardinichthys multiradiatus]|uniref:immunoglobulin lambda-1 light chain-like n=1 Tax=Girardinichthys multiradiatus TaxID=208333 RepID=UPI001FAE0605|nr:immunoglobulin lambda-1 light chain-like [Girardinichthys multiradiatus]